MLNEPGPPEGCSINGRGGIDSVITSGGIARARLTAGTMTGPKLLNAYTWRDESRMDTVSTIISAIVVIGGPPDQIDLDVDNEGVDAGGGIWRIEVSARVYDEYRNPVRDGIPVQFTCDSIASISNGWTGNEGLHGQSEQGIAFAILTYHSFHTFDTVTVTASIRTVERTIEASRMIILPLQQGSLTLNVSPDSWMIDAPHMGTTNFVCVATLRDGHDVLINNAPVLFSSNRAYFYWYNYFRAPHYVLYDLFADPPEPPIKYTGWNFGNGHREHRENPGEATVYLRGEEWDFFLDAVSPEVNVQVMAQVVGYEDVIARPVIVVVTRHP